MRSMIICGLALFVAGCGAGKADSDGAKERDEHVWSNQTEALDKARGVQDTLDKAHEVRTEEDPER